MAAGVGGTLLLCLPNKDSPQEGVRALCLIQQSHPCAPRTLHCLLFDVILMFYWTGQRVLKDPSEPCGSYAPGLGSKCGKDHVNPGTLGPSFLSPLLHPG